eukprot:2340641-Lingulodinium_polyedra.AAC.1
MGRLSTITRRRGESRLATPNNCAARGRPWRALTSCKGRKVMSPTSQRRPSRGSQSLCATPEKERGKVAGISLA